MGPGITSQPQETFGRVPPFNLKINTLQEETFNLLVLMLPKENFEGLNASMPSSGNQSEAELVIAFGDVG